MASIIKKKDANDEVRNYLKIQKEAKTKKCFDKLPSGSPAEKFYNQAQEISFYFEKDKVLYLMSKPGAEFLRVYYGAKSTGEPTIILTAAKTGNSIHNIITSDDESGIEWPTGLPTYQSNPENNFDLDPDAA
jgi:hypothetical protein